MARGEGAITASSRAEQIIVRTFALFRLAEVVQVFFALALAMPRVPHVLWLAALAAAVLAESVLLVVACWRRNRIPGAWAICDVAFTAAALAVCARLTAPADYNTWANFMYPFSLIEVLIAGLGLARLRSVMAAALALATTYASSAVAIHGDPLWNVLPNAVTYLANAGVSWLIAGELRRSGRRLDEQRQLAVAQAEELTRAGEHARAARLLHDRVLQTLEMLSHPLWIADQRLRGQVAAEASWLRRFVEHDLEEGTTDLLDTVHRVCDRHAGSGLALEVNDATVRAAPGSRPALSAAVLAALEGALDETLTNVSKHSGVQCATVRVAATELAVSVSVLDHGRGFDPARCSEGFGLGHSIRARIDEVGGRVRVEAWPGHGTHVELWVPVSDDTPAHAVDDAG